MPHRPALPPVDSAPGLLRAAIKAKGQTEGWAALHVFKVQRPCMSGWLNRKFRPNAHHREIAQDEYGIALAAWDNKKERAERVHRLESETAAGKAAA